MNKVLKRINLMENKKCYELAITNAGITLNIFTENKAICNIEYCGVFHKKGIALHAISRVVNRLLSERAERFLSKFTPVEYGDADDLFTPEFWVKTASQHRFDERMEKSY